ncbi:MAG TPA: polyketide synthase, partial [Longimicrobiaceae bacterium]|nr:polyketide synthase [Longimicrobiaceae bacterium]
MSGSTDAAEYATRLRQALGTIQRLRARAEAAERAAAEPIAIVGMGCRFPGGADSPAAFWRLLRDGVDAVTEVPPDRWDADAHYDPDPDAPGKSVSRWGSFLDGIDRFDAQFFSIAPREAEAMDPQQRLLLEVSWEALEDAGMDPTAQAGTRCGVYVGIAAGDYQTRQVAAGNAAGFDFHTITGNFPSFLSGRVSHLLGLQGPSLAVSTACSSSLVAVHLACRALRAGECDAALAGGANVLLAPEVTSTISRSRALAPDGRCKTFDAAADGYVRGEGCGVVVLKRLADARRDGDRVLAVIRGSAVNHDGDASGGITVPSGEAQRRLVEEAVAGAGIDPLRVGYVEAHGTGTPLGDPIELRALAGALCRGRPADRPLWVGSVKTNLGHTEAAAGIAGLIKAVLALRHAEIPPHLHFREGNPMIDWSAPVRVPSAAEPWPAGGEPRVAGVSSFGISGTNAHVIVEEAPADGDVDEAPAEDGERTLLLPVSARSEGALRELARAYRDRLTAPDAPPA